MIDSNFFKNVQNNTIQFDYKFGETKPPFYIMLGNQQPLPEPVPVPVTVPVPASAPKNTTDEVKYIKTFYETFLKSLNNQGKNLNNIEFPTTKDLEAAKDDYSDQLFKKDIIPETYFRKYLNNKHVKDINQKVFWLSQYLKSS